MNKEVVGRSLGRRWICGRVINGQQEGRAVISPEKVGFRNCKKLLEIGAMLRVYGESKSFHRE